MPKLNDRQQAAVEHVSGPLLVLAGAGSGKTRVITEKIGHLIEHAGVEPQHIVAVTFTNKASREMRERVGKRLPRDVVSRMRISTFHRLGLDVLREEHHHIGLRANVSILDSEDTSALIRDLGVTEPDRIKLALRWISDRKQALQMPADTAASAETEADATLARLYEQYESHLAAYNAVDFDDLIVKPTRLLQDNETVRNRWQNRIRYLLVDEYQDTNPVQYAMMRALVGVRARFTVVGDDDQSIYRFRGARPENLADLKTDYPELDVIKLEQNYRSTSRILRSANSVIERNTRLYQKTLWSALGEGTKLRVVNVPDDAVEAERVVTLLSTHRIRSGDRWSDYAILYRSNHQARVIEQALRAQNIAYRMTGGRSFFDRAEVKDLVAYLRLLANPDDDRAFLRIINVPRRELGPATLQRLGNYAQERHCPLLQAAQEATSLGMIGGRQGAELARFCNWHERLSRTAAHMRPDHILAEMIAELAYRDWIAATTPDKVRADRKFKLIDELMDWTRRLAEDDRSLEDVVNHFSLVDMLDKQDGGDEVDEVQLATLHASKGLEFRNVFIVGMVDGILPHENTDDVDEERRLFYVGITRAQSTLTLTVPRQIKRGGELVDVPSSRFLEELPETDVDWPDEAQDAAEQQAQRARQLAALRARFGAKSDPETT